MSAEPDLRPGEPQGLMKKLEPLSPVWTGHDPDHRLYGPLPDVQADAGYAPDHPGRVGFFTDTSVCIGCKACEVACKEWNTLPMDDSHGRRDVIGLSGMSYDNTGQLGANTWRHVAFVGQTRTVDLPAPTMRPGAAAQRQGSGPSPAAGAEQDDQLAEAQAGGLDATSPTASDPQATLTGGTT